MLLAFLLKIKETNKCFIATSMEVLWLHGTKVRKIDPTYGTSSLPDRYEPIGISKKLDETWEVSVHSHDASAIDHALDALA